VLGENNTRMAASLQQLAYLYTALGRYSEATDLYNRSLAILQSCLDSSHPEITDALNKLAWLQLKCGTRRLDQHITTDIVRMPPQLNPTLCALCRKCQKGR